MEAVEEDGYCNPVEMQLKKNRNRLEIPQEETYPIAVSVVVVVEIVSSIVIVRIRPTHDFESFIESSFVVVQVAVLLALMNESTQFHANQ